MGVETPFILGIFIEGRSSLSIIAAVIVVVVIVVIVDGVTLFYL